VNESDARTVVFVRAIEFGAAQGGLVADAERAQLGRAAVELARWQAAGQGRPAGAEDFIVQRAKLLITRIGETSKDAARAFEKLRWRPVLGLLAPLLAFLLGALVEHVVDRHRLNILAFPLLGLVVWNISIYLWLLLRWLRPGKPAMSAMSRLLHSALAGLGKTLLRRLPSRVASWHEDFIRTWIACSAPLTSARLARILHLSAAALAIGAIAGLFLRGLLFEYRAGWESTFLDAPQVHAILAALVQPFAQLMAQPFPDVDHVAALRWDRGDGENAAPWIYLYSCAVSTIVILPRLGLAALAWFRERALSRHFPLDLDDAYFRRVLGSWRTVPAQVRVLPYAYGLGEPVSAGLHRLVRQHFGDGAQLHVLPTMAFGEEDTAELKPSSASPKPDLDIVLFNLASTPESEHHGVLLERLQAKGNPGVAILVDESAYRARLGAQSATDQRLQERREAWTAFASARQLKLSCIDLQAGDTNAFELALAGQSRTVDGHAHAH
jgi:Protein of unknown function (DUF2868)